MRYFLGVNRFCPVAGIVGDMGWTSHDLGRYLCTVRFWNRLIKMPENRLTKKFFVWDKERSDGWCSEIKKVFQKLEIMTSYNETQICDIEDVKIKLNSLMSHTWLQDVNGKPTLRTYKLFKNDFIPEKDLIY